MTHPGIREAIVKFFNGLLPLAIAVFRFLSQRPDQYISRNLSASFLERSEIVTADLVSALEETIFRTS